MAFPGLPPYTHKVQLRVLFLSAAIVLAPVGARAVTANVAAGDQPVVVVSVRQGTIVVRAVPGDAVRVTAARGRIESSTWAPSPDDNVLDILPTSVQTANGRRIDLPTETFTFTPLHQGKHVNVHLLGDAVGNVTVEVPRRPSVILVKAERGRVRVEGLRQDVIVVKLHHGAISVSHFSGAAYLQSGGGPIDVEDSDLHHARLRSATTPIVLRNCTVRQVQASSVLGDVIADNTTFSPGVARFDSSEGAVALGIGNGGAQVSGTTDGGRIFTSLDPRSHSQVDAGSVSSSIHGGGPVVTMRSERGNLFLYDGSLMERKPPAPAWRRLIMTLRRLTML